MKKILKIVGIVFLALIVLSAIGSSGDKKAEETTAAIETTTEAEPETTKPTEAETTKEETAPETTVAETESQESLRKSFIALSKIVLDENYPDHYSIMENDDNIFINIWGDGVALEATAVKQNPTAENMEKWNTMKSGIESRSNSMQNLADEMGYTETICLNVLNDMNKDNVLLSYVRGVCILDAMND